MTPRTDWEYNLFTSMQLESASARNAELKLALYFQELAQGERNIEIVREVLAKQYLFEPGAAFAHLAGTGKTRLNTFDLQGFAKYRGFVNICGVGGIT